MDGWTGRWTVIEGTLRGPRRPNKVNIGAWKMMVVGESGLSTRSPVGAGTRGNGRLGGGGKGWKSGKRGRERGKRGEQGVGKG